MKYCTTLKMTAMILAISMTSQAMAGTTHLYNFDGNGLDSVGSADLTITGGTFVAGVPGQALRVENVNPGGNPPATQYAFSSFDFNPDDPANWAFSADVRFDTLPPGSAGIISIGDILTGNNLWMSLSSAGTFSAFQQNVAGVAGTTSVQTGTWYDVSVRVVDGTVELWVDGSMEGSFAAGGGGIDPNAGIMVGAMYFNNLADLGDAVRGLDGAVDNFRIVNGVIPEPASLALLGVGGLILLRRRR